MSEQEWRDAITGVISGPLPPSADPESHDHGLWLSNQRLADVLLAAVAPLRERERQQARQEALTEAAAIVEEMSNAPSDPASVFGQGWTSGLSAAQTVIDSRAAGGGS